MADVLDGDDPETWYDWCLWSVLRAVEWGFRAAGTFGPGLVLASALYYMAHH